VSKNCIASLIVPGQDVRLVEVQTQPDQTIVCVSSESTIWRGMFATLDTVGEMLSGEPVRLLDETDAIIAACLRYSSYFHALTCGLAYNWSKGESRINDSEMRCINIEFSAALAQWWRDREEDVEKVNRRVRAALLLLPTTWRENRDDLYRFRPDFDKLMLSDIGAELKQTLNTIIEASQPDTIQKMLHLDIRQEANRTVSQCWRNDEQVEAYHSGWFSSATNLCGYCRFDAAEVDELMLHVAYSLAGEVKQHNDGDLRMRAIVVNTDPLMPRRWSMTDETADIIYPVTDEVDAVRAHVHQAISCCPNVYKEVEENKKAF
jgi:hypothetical protein